jgi:hypothetical protein
MIYTDYRNLPGPGDEETWGPCLNHPNDPRTPDWSGDIEVKQEEVYEERIKDINGYFVESFSEAHDDDLKKLSDAVVARNSGLIASIVLAMVEAYCTPDEAEAMELINEDRERYEPDY